MLTRPAKPHVTCHADPFQLDIETAIEVLAEDEESRAALEQSLDEAGQGPFDICPPVAAATMQPLAPLGGSKAAEARAGPGASRAAPRVEGRGAGVLIVGRVAEVRIKT
jgi:hypothetical protein